MYKKKLKIISVIMSIFIIIPIVGIINLLSFSKEVFALNTEVNKNYVVDLNKFGIKNNETAPIETTKGINEALKYAKDSGYTKVTMPSGVYLISENESIIMQDNITLDLNGATFKMNPNGLQKYVMINFTGCNNAKLINGTLLGDRYTHDYNTIKGSHEWTCGIIFNDSENSGIDNVIVKEFPGYGITSSIGKNISNLIIGVTTQNLKIGNITPTGVLNDNVGTIRTIEPMDISKVGNEFELGYDKGYMGYPYMQARTYDSYFYDENMNLISYTKDCKQYKKVSIPKVAKYVHFVFNQSVVPNKGDTDFRNTTVFLTNYRSPYKISITNSVIEGNRSLGMGLCGGRQFLIEGNTFKKNGGGAPGYAVDLEDGWEYMDGYLFKNNKFIENKNDVVVCAGDNIVFEGNEFSSTVCMYGRTTNYKFLNNIFRNITQNINYEFSTDTVCSGNIYINSKMVLTKKKEDTKLDISNETIINGGVNAMSPGIEMKNSTIISDGQAKIRLVGSFRDCNINAKRGDILSAKLYNCSIKDTEVFLGTQTYFEGCTIYNSLLGSTTDTEKMHFNKCNFTDSMIGIATSGKASESIVENSIINMKSKDRSIVRFSAGKMKNLIFKNNTVNNLVNMPTINMNDTSYSVPNGNVLIENNNITQTMYKYIFDGLKIDSGIVNFSEKNNTLNGSQMLNPKYINNQYFKIAN